MHVLATLQRRLARGLLYLAALALVLLTLLITANVLGRWLIGSGVRGSEELSIYLMLATVYLGLAGTLADGEFIRVELLAGRLRGRAPMVLYGAAVTLSLAFCLLLATYAWSETLSSFLHSGSSIGELRVPLGWPKVVIAIGTSVLCLQLLVMLVAFIKDPRGSTAASPGSQGTDQLSSTTGSTTQAD